MIDDMQVYIANLGKYNEGELVGDWFSLPLDEEVIAERIGLNAEYEDCLLYTSLKEKNAELLIDGKKVSNNYEFTADNEKMTVEIAFTFDGSSLGGKNLVTFEELYDMTNPDEPKKVTEHKDITDDGQTVTIKEVPEIPDTPKDTDTPDTPSTVTKTSDSPKTGDNTNIYAYLAMLGFSCVGLGGMLYFKRRRKKL